MLREGQYKLIVFGHALLPPPTRRKGEGGGAAAAARLFPPRVFNIEADPHETNDLARTRPDLVRSLRQSLGEELDCEGNDLLAKLQEFALIECLLSGAGANVSALGAEKSIALSFLHGTVETAEEREAMLRRWVASARHASKTLRHVAERTGRGKGGMAQMPLPPCHEPLASNRWTREFYDQPVRSGISQSPLCYGKNLCNAEQQRGRERGTGDRSRGGPPPGRGGPPRGRVAHPPRGRVTGW